MPNSLVTSLTQSMKNMCLLTVIATVTNFLAIVTSRRGLGQGVKMLIFKIVKQPNFGCYNRNIFTA